MFLTRLLLYTRCRADPSTLIMLLLTSWGGPAAAVTSALPVAGGTPEGIATSSGWVQMSASRVVSSGVSHVDESITVLAWSSVSPPLYHLISALGSMPSSAAVGVTGAAVVVGATEAGTTRRRFRRGKSGQIFHFRLPPLPPRPLPFPFAAALLARPAGGFAGAVLPHESPPCLTHKHLLHWCTLLELAGQVIPAPCVHWPDWKASHKGRGTRLVVYLPLTTLRATLRALGSS